MMQDVERELDPEVAARTREVLRAMVRDERGRDRRRPARIGVALAVAAVAVIAMLLVPRSAEEPPEAVSPTSVDVICVSSAAVDPAEVRDGVRETVRLSSSRSVTEQALEACASLPAVGTGAEPEAAVPQSGGALSEQKRTVDAEFQLGGPQEATNVAVCVRDDGALVVVPAPPRVCSALELAEFEEATP